MWAIRGFDFVYWGPLDLGAPRAFFLLLVGKVGEMNCEFSPRLVGMQIFFFIFFFLSKHLCWPVTFARWPCQGQRSIIYFYFLKFLVLPRLSDILKKNTTSSLYTWIWPLATFDPFVTSFLFRSRQVILNWIYFLGRGAVMKSRAII